jgi:4-azaleucine resistance transporter AzlC
LFEKTFSIMSTSEFRAGLVRILPVCIAAVPIGFLWGALSQKAGLSPFESGLMSASVFAGASQFVAIGLWKTPIPMFSIILATFLINLRHVIMGASISRRMDGFSLPQKLLALFPLADETWALAEARAREAPLTPSFYLGLAAPFVPVWVLASVLGNLFGAALGDPKTYGFDFVFNVIFIALVVGFRHAPGWLMAVLASTAVSVVTFQFLPSPWYVLLGAVAGMAAAAFFSSPKSMKP